MITEADGAEDTDVRQTESDRNVRHKGNRQNSVDEPEKNDKDLLWLLEGKIVMYKKQPLSKFNRKVFYGRQQFSITRWREIAIKLIENNEKNHGELDFLVKLHHPNIVQIFDAGEYQAGVYDYLYIVMELCAQNLRTYVDENNFNFQVAFSFSKQLAAGLVFLHENKVAHRDLKPDNVLISFDKKTIKLSDFGLSKEIPEGQSAATVTTVGAGTQGFRSPETYQPDTRVSPSVDIFPYGLVTYFTFTEGKHPFGTNPNEQPYNIMKNLNRDLSLIPQFDKPNSHKRKQLLDLLDQTTQHNPRDRPSAEEIQKHAFFTETGGDDVDRTIRGLEETKLSGPRSSRLKEFENSGGGEALSTVSTMTSISSEIETDGVERIRGTRSEIDADGMERIQEIQDQLKKPLNEIGFPRSAQLLSELRELRGSDDLDILLQMAECELQLARGKEEESIQRTRDFISNSGSYSSADVRDMANELRMSKCYVRSLILYRISNDLYETQNVSPDVAMKWIRDRLINVSHAAKPLIEADSRSRDIGIKFGLEYMESLLNEIRSMGNASPDVIALNQAYCLVSITARWNIAGEYQKSIRFGSEGVEILEKQFGVDASKHNAYSMLLHNLGTAHRNSGHYSDAERYYVRSLEASEKASDFETEGKKVGLIEGTKRSLAKTRRLSSD